MKLKKNEAMWAYILLAPALIGLSIFAIIPVVSSFIYSTLDWFGFRDPSFIGLQNFKELFSDPIFYQSLFNTIRIAFIVVPLSILISCVIASLLNQKIKGITIYRILFYLPVVTMPAAIAVVFKNFFNSDFGWANGFMNALGLPSVSWLGNPDISWIVLCFIVIWTMIGFQILIVLASMQNIPASLYEAATMDGASPTRKFFSVTLPMVSPSIFFLAITGLVGAFQLFDIVFLMIGKGTGIDSTRTLMYYFYDTAFANSDRGYGSAIIVVVFFILTFISIINFRLQKKIVTYDR